MSPNGSRRLVVILVTGTALRLAVAFICVGSPFDIDSFRIVDRHLQLHPLTVYETARWPYPPGYFIWIRITGLISEHTPLSFHGVIKLPAVAADIGLALLVVWFLRRRGASEGRQLMGAALVAFGPSFFLISAYHGQIDALAILPALTAVAVWLDPPRSYLGGRIDRAFAAGLLIGVGGAVKIVPLAVVVALLPSARSMREGARLVAATAVVPVVLVTPFLLASPSATLSSLRYTGIPGVGGLSLVVQPGLGAGWIVGEVVAANHLVHTMADTAGGIAALIVIAAFLLVWRLRLQPVDAAVLLWLMTYAFTPNFFFQYAVWGLPFFIAAGHLAKVGWVQLALLVPTVLAEGRLWDDSRVMWLYLPAMIGTWFFVVAALSAFIAQHVALLRVAPAPHGSRANKQ